MPVYDQHKQNNHLTVLKLNWGVSHPEERSWSVVCWYSIVTLQLLILPYHKEIYTSLSCILQTVDFNFFSDIFFLSHVFITNAQLDRLVLRCLLQEDVLIIPLLSTGAMRTNSKTRKKFPHSAQQVYRIIETSTANCISVYNRESEYNSAFLCVETVHEGQRNIMAFRIFLSFFMTMFMFVSHRWI